MIFYCDAGHLIEDGDAVALLRPEHVVVLLARGEPVTVVISAVLRSVFVSTRALSEGYPKVPEDFTITEKAPTKAFSWLVVKSLRTLR